MRVVFAVLGAPKNWKQEFNLTRGGMIAKHNEMKKWQTWVAWNGNRARRLHEVPECTENDPPRQVHIHQQRHGELDLDGLVVSCTPLIDGLRRRMQRWITKKGNKQPIYDPGAFLLWDDKPRYLNKVTASQERIPRSEVPKVTIYVEIPE